jgi:hypothetical protein
MKYIIAIISLSISIWGYGQTQASKDKLNFQTIDRGSYSIQYPLAWIIDTSRQFGSDLFLLSANESEMDKFKENVNVMIQNLKGLNLDLDKFVQVSESQVKTYVTNGKVLESKRINQNGLEFHKLIYLGTQGAFSLKTEQYYFIKDEKAFVVTFVAEEDQFDKYIVIAEKMMQSFKIKE